MTEAFDDDVDRLYGLPLDEFVAERTLIAKRLRGAGRREDAAAVAKLPKPTVAAWAANQALRSQRADARELLAAGEAVGDAQNDLLAGRGDRGALDDAVARHRKTLGRLTDAARGLLDADGRELSPTTLERVRETLSAVSLDPDLRPDAEAPRLVREQSYSGFGLGSFTGQVKPSRPAARKQPAKAGTKAKTKGRGKGKAASDAKARAKAEREIKKAEQQAGAAARAVTAAAKKARAAAAAQEKAAARRAEADAALEDARAREAQAAQALRRLRDAAS